MACLWPPGLEERTVRKTRDGFPPSFHGGNWTCCLINPTSVGAHIADLKTLPADFLFLPEVSLTAGAQRYATKELAGGERGLNTVWGAP